jgi:hypothetical protein
MYICMFVYINLFMFVSVNFLGACSYGQKLSRLARKPFDKFTSAISPCYENNMKSYTTSTFI